MLWENVADKNPSNLPVMLSGTPLIYNEPPGIAPAARLVHSLVLLMKLIGTTLLSVNRPFDLGTGLAIGLVAAGDQN
jgi:hypothetical protein